MKQAVIEARRKPEPVEEIKEEVTPAEETVKPHLLKENRLWNRYRKNQKKKTKSRYERKQPNWQKFL